jgi:hypothetical protein
MDETASGGLKLTGNIFLTIALISICVLLFAIGVAAVKIAQDKMTGVTENLQNTEYTTYDNGKQSGSQVLNAIRQYMSQDSFGVQVVTGKGGNTVYGNTFNATTGEISGTKNTNLAPAQDQANANYINPSGKFSSRVIYDPNGVVRGIVFTQEVVSISFNDSVSQVKSAA